MTRSAVAGDSEQTVDVVAEDPVQADPGTVPQRPRPLRVVAEGQQPLVVHVVDEAARPPGPAHVDGFGAGGFRPAYGGTAAVAQIDRHREASRGAVVAPVPEEFGGATDEPQPGVRAMRA